MQIILVRGLPGSGKSTFAKQFNCLHLETDMFFMQDGEYQFDSTKLSENHARCKRMFEGACEYGMDVVVSNTFSRKWEMEDYINLAHAHGVVPAIYKCIGNYGNTHGVPEGAIQHMVNRWEDVDGEIVVDGSVLNAG